MAHTCAICTEDITQATGRVETSCHHHFHFSCLGNWYLQRLNSGQDETCPCCRAEAGPTERLSTDDGEDDGSEGSDESEFSELDEGEAAWLTRADLENFLKNTLGGTGVPDALWFSFFDEDEEERLATDRRLPFTQRETLGFALAQGGRGATDEEWDALAERFPEPEADDEEDGEAAEGEDGEAVVEAPQAITLTRTELEDEVVWPNGGVGVSPAQWAQLAGERETMIFFRCELDAYLARADQSGRPLTDEAWASLHARFAAPRTFDGAPSLRITWRRRADGSWERVVLNPEEVEPAVWGEGDAHPPPDDLVRQTNSAARRFQAVWKGYTERKKFEVVRNLLALRTAA